jgi:phosphoribosylaminoimidazolecarboxamide formyltransferase/IMP cyclohydrolase
VTEVEPRTRVAVCVSRRGTNLRSLVEAARAGRLPIGIVLVVADRPCPALAWAEAESLPTVLLEEADPGAFDARLAEALSAARPGVVVLAGFMRLVGTRTLSAFAGRILNVHPALLPAFPGAHAVRDALAHGVKTTGVTVHVVDETLDGGPILLQEAVMVRPTDDEETLLERIHPVEHRLLAQAILLLDAGAVSVSGRRASIDPATAGEAMLPPRRALLSVSDKAGLAAFARGLHELGFELVSTGGTAAALRDEGLPVTDVASITGVAEMLDGRVKTLHPRIHGGILADRSVAAHRAQLAEAAIAPFALVVVNLYPFARAAERPGISLPELVEEIDVGGPTLVRAAAKNFSSVAVVTSPARYDGVLADLRQGGEVALSERSALSVEAFRHVAAYDARIAAELPVHMAASMTTPGEAALPEAVDRLAADPFPAVLPIALEKVKTLRYGENPHQAAALYRRPGTPPERGPFASGAELLQGKALSYNNVLDASGAVALARDLRGPACAIVKHTNPCGAAEADDPVTAWERALAGDPVSAFGGVVALTRTVDAAVAERLAAIFLEVLVAPDYSEEARATLVAKPNLRLLVHPPLADAPGTARSAADPLAEIRSAGGGVLVGSPDDQPDDPATWRVVTSRAPTDAEARDLDLAWRIARHVKSNAIVLVRDGALVGVGAGQMSRVDSARLAVAKAGDRAPGSACASDAFYPFADGVEVCLEAGVRAFVQPGGSVRDAEVIAAAESAGATMLLTGKRHFRH